MTQPLTLPCSDECQTKAWCLNIKGCGHKGHHDQEGDEFMCPTLGMCPSPLQEDCDSLGACKGETWTRPAIAFLVDALGESTVQLVSGSDDPQIVQKWLGETESPTEEERERILFAFEQFQTVALAARTTYAARLWFGGTSVSGNSPAVAIKNGDFEGVRASVGRQVNDYWD